VNYIMDKTGAIQKTERNGKTYLALKDFGKMRQGVGMLLAELMRIKAEGDYAAIKALVDQYGVHFDPKCATRWWRATRNWTCRLTGAASMPR
jgi:dipeptidyl-peptidase-3